MSEVNIQAKDGSGGFMAYVARPAQTPAPAVIVIQEIFGVNAVMRDICDKMAGAGFLAVCPDLFWRQEPGIQITDKSEAEWARAFELYKGFDENKGVEDLAATLDFIRDHKDCNGKVGDMGFCLGGKLAYLMAARTDADASVSYYGVGIENALGEVKNIRKPLLMHIAQEDKFVSKDAQEKITAALAGNKNVEVRSYPGVNHAFARIGGEHYDEAAANAANERTLNFLKSHLAQAYARQQRG